VENKKQSVNTVNEVIQPGKLTERSKWSYCCRLWLLRVCGESGSFAEGKCHFIAWQL